MGSQLVREACLRNDGLEWAARHERGTCHVTRYCIRDAIAVFLKCRASTDVTRSHNCAACSLVQHPTSSRCAHKLLVENYRHN